MYEQRAMRNTASHWNWKQTKKHVNVKRKRNHRRRRKKKWEIICHETPTKNSFVRAEKWLRLRFIVIIQAMCEHKCSAFYANRSHLFSFIIEIVPFQLKLTQAAWGGSRIQKRKKKQKPKLIKYLDAANEFRLHGIIVQWWLLVATRFALSFAREYIAASAATFDQTSKHDKSSDKLRCEKAMHFWMCVLFSSFYLCHIFVVRYLLYVT